MNGLPIAVVGVVEGDYEVEDVFGFGGDLTEGDSGAGEGGSGGLLVQVSNCKWPCELFTC